ncbi:MAG: G1 family glutamic endopeptidase, partial [Trebonia sp.]
HAAVTASHAAAAVTVHGPGVNITHGKSVNNGGVAVHLAGSGTSPASSRGAIAHEAESTNWSGYAADSGTYTSVSASWVQPTATCRGRSDLYSSFWVGLDGYTSGTVEQTGTDSDCNGSSPSYYGWYETYPNPSYNFGDTIEPGDTIDASVTYEGSNHFLYKLQDTTRNWSVSTTQTEAGASRSSAEVIVEAPCCTNSGGILPLANFGTAHFSESLVNGSAIGNTAPAEIIMIDNSGADKDTVSSLSGGENWSATWVRSN